MSVPKVDLQIKLFLTKYLTLGEKMGLGKGESFLQLHIDELNWNI